MNSRLPTLLVTLSLVSHLSLHAAGDHAADDELALAAAQLTATSKPVLIGAPSAVSVTASLVDPADCINNGSWGAVIPWTPHIPVSASNLPDGRILTFASNQRTTFPVGPEFTYAAAWNPATGAFQEFNNTSHDMFCGGITLMTDGRVMVNGGRNETPYTSVFDWRTNTWTRVQNMTGGRWYNTSVSLPNGNVFTATGSGTGTSTTERWSTAGWTLLSGIGWPAVTDADAGYFKYWHPFVSVAPDGRLLHFGPTDTMHWFTVTGTGSFVNANATVPGAHYPKEGCWVMYDEGRVLVAGGGANTTAQSADTSIGTSTNIAYTVNMNTTPPTLTPTASMQYPRQFVNTVVLPSGEVLVIGGNSPGQKFSDNGSIMPCEIWNPKTGAWRTVASITVPRNYHSVALLMPDGRVWSAGGGLGGGDHQDAQLYTPPCLFTSTGAPATRPVLNTAPTRVGPGTTFNVSGTTGLVKFAFIRMAALTHSVNTDQRYLSLPFTESTAGNYQITAHSNINVMTPGYWMLFGINSTGAYSVAKVIQVDTSTAPSLANPGAQNLLIGAPASVQLIATAPSGTLSYSATGLPTGLTINTSTGLISGIPTVNGTFTVQATATTTGGSSVQSFTWTIFPASTSRSFSNFTGATGLTFNGSAAIASSVLRLTSTTGAGAGSAYLTLPVGIGADTSFSTRFNFRIGGGTGADGMAFLIQGNFVNALGATGGGLGYGTIGKCLAVEMDEFMGPGDPNANHLGVTINGVTETHLVTYTPSFTLANNASHTMWVDYDGSTNTLRVYLSQAVTATKPATAVMTLTNVDLPALVGSTAWFGFSGGIGGLTNNHDVEAWDINVVSSTNTPPVVTSPGNRTNVIGTALTLNVTATDANADTLTYSATGLPSGLTINSATGVINGTPNAMGSFTPTISVTDSKNPAVSVSFQWTINDVVNLTPTAATTTRAAGTAITFTASSTGGLNVKYKWSWGDSTADTAYSTSTTASHTFTAPGRYQITLSATDDTGRLTTYTFYQAINATLTTQSPRASSSIIYEARTTASSRVWAVNGDNNSVSVFDAVTRARLAEVNVGTAPRALALAPNGNVWVTNAESSTVSIISGSTLAVVQTITLPRGSRPFGIAFSPNGTNGWIACEGTGLLLRMNPTSGAQAASLAIGSDARHVSVSADSARVFVTRFITPLLPGESTATVTTSSTTGGEVFSVLTSNLSIEKKTVLLHSDRADTITTGRGIPNYLGPAIISPDNLTAWVPSKQDNIKRGKLRDGNDLTHDQTVRSIASRIALTSGSPALTDDTTNRVDFDNAGIAVNGAFESKGIYLFTALEGSREVGIVDVWNKKEIARFSAGRAPQGIAVSSDGRTVFVQNFMDRTITVHNAGEIIDGRTTQPTLIATLNCITTERLDATVLLGKKHFYDAADSRIAFQQYISCASCHNDGGEDGRVWDFTGFGEGLRNTITLRGQGGTRNGPVHWSGNFDEIQDFENQIRSLPHGTGLITTGDPNPPLGAPNAGRSADLDALALFVSFLTATDASPSRNSDGSLTASAQAGKLVFGSNNCASCHSGTRFTDSAVNVLHDVGTIKAASGTRLGATLTGLDTPTLRGVWNTAPYLHDGSAATIDAAILAHTNVPKPAAGSQALTDLVNYLKQIDDLESSSPVNRAPTVTTPVAQTTVRGSAASLQIVASDPDANPLTYSATGLPLGLSINSTSGLISGTVSATAASTNNAVVTVSDGTLSATASFTWNTTAPTSTGPNLTGADIGTVAAAGSTSVTNGVFTVKGSGDNIYYVADSCQFASVTVNGDADIRARVTSMTNSGDWAKAGVMVRENSTAGSRMALMCTTPEATGNGFDMVYRTTANGAATDTYFGNPNPVPNNWVRLVRAGNVLTGYVSANGTTWTQINAITYTSLPANLLFGLAVTAYNNGMLCTATFDNVQIIGGGTVTAPAAPTNVVASNVTGTVKLTWTDNATNETSYRIERATGSGTFATIATLAADATSYTDSTVAASTTYNFKVSAVNSGGTGVSSVVPITTPASTGINLAGADIGAVGATGSTSLASGVYTVKGSGDNIYYIADSCHFASTTISGDADIRARLTSMTNSGDWAKAGVMIRENTAAGARMALTCSTPSATNNGFDYVYRTTTNGAATDTYFGNPNPVPNNWVRLTRTGNVITSYVSANGTSWTLLNSITYTSLPSSMLYGLAVTAYTNGTLCTATFDNVQITTGTAAAGLAVKTNLSTGASSGSSSATASFSTTPNADGTTSLGYTRVLGAQVFVTLQTIDDLANSPTGWRTSTLTPTIVSNGDGTETLSFADVSRAFTGDQGFARVHIEQDLTGDGIADVLEDGEVFGFVRRTFPTGTFTTGNAFAPAPLMTAQITAVNGSIVTLSKSLPSLATGRQCYLEVVLGVHQGHRLDLNEASISGASVILDTTSTRTTLSALPSTLVGDTVVLRAHATVSSLFPESLFTASSSPTTSDRVLFFNGTGYDTLWLLRKPDGAKQWLRAGDATASNVGTRIVDVAEGAMVQVRGATVTLTTSGFVRAHRVALPLKQGTQLVANVSPGRRSLNSLRMNVEGGFVASTSISTADRVDLFKPDADATTAGYRSLSLIGTNGTAQWIAAGEGSANLGDVALVGPMQSFFVKSTNAKPDFMVPLTWRP